jgi:GNAT superfamily N-acetyltransferase
MQEGNHLIRRIKREDIEEIIPLFHQLWPGIKLDPKEIMEILNIYIQENNYDMYCYVNEKIQGLITITQRDAFYYGGKVAIIEDLVVDEKYREHDIGRILVEFVENELKRKGIKTIELASDLHRNQAHEFWEKLGYKKLAYQFRKNFNNR